MRARRGCARRAGGGAARPARARARPRLLRTRRLRGQPGQPAAGVHRGHGRAAASTRCASRTSSTGATLPDVDRRTSRTAIAWIGRQPHACCTSRRTRRRCSALRVRKHRLGTDPAQDPCRLRGARRQPSTLDVGRTKDGRYLLIDSQSTVTTEHALRATPTDPDARVQGAAAARAAGTSITAEHVDGRWIIRTNWQALEFPADAGCARARRATVAVAEILVAHRDDALLAGFDVFRRVPRDRGALRRPAQGPGAAPWNGGEPSSTSASDEPAYRMALGANEEIDSTVVRYTYTSLTTPRHHVRLRRATPASRSC